MQADMRDKIARYKRLLSHVIFTESAKLFRIRKVDAQRTQRMHARMHRMDACVENLVVFFSSFKHPPSTIVACVRACVSLLCMHCVHAYACVVSFFLLSVCLCRSWSLRTRAPPVCCCSCRPK